MDIEPNPHDIEKERLLSLADELDRIWQEKAGGTDDVLMKKLILFLRNGDARAAKIFLNNEFDKFTLYREDAIPLIIKELYGGRGSPCFIIERKLKTSKFPESLK